MDPTIGLAFPPPDLRNMIDKVAETVNRLGAPFEARLSAKNDAKLAFLNSEDPYRPYYEYRL